MNNALYIHLHKEVDPQSLAPVEQPELIIGPVEVVVIHGALHLFDADSEHGYFSDTVLEIGEGNGTRFGHRLFNAYTSLQVELNESVVEAIQHRTMEHLTLDQVRGLRIDLIESTITYTFTTNMVRQYSSTAKAEDLGRASGSMVLTKSGNSYQIEWVINYANGDQDVEHIGLDVEGDTLTGYDGVMCLPREACTLVRFAGIIVPEDMQ